MATEDDTFNALRKITFEQLNELVRNESSFDEVKKICNQYGWSHQEFYRENVTRMIRKISNL